MDDSQPTATRCVLVGDEALVAQCADAARANGLDVVLIATTNSIVEQYATSHGIAVTGPGAALVDALDDHPADVLFSIANLRVLPEAVLERAATAINFHDGPLPDYAGLNVTTWAILAGEDHHAITWHMMTSDIDAGDVVVTERFPIADDETAFSLNARCYEAALATFPRIAAAIAEGALTTSSQPDGDARMFRRHDRPAVLLDPAAPAAASARAIRALDLGHRLRNSIGAVRLVVGDDVFVVEGASVVAPTGNAAPGTVVSVGPDGLRLATADDDLVIATVSTPEGRPIDHTELGRLPGLRAGSVLPSPPPALVASIAELEPSFSRHELFWLDRLTEAEPTQPPMLRPGSWTSTNVDVSGADDASVLAAVAVWLARVGATESPTFSLADDRTRELLGRTAPLTRPGTFTVSVDAEQSFDDARQAVVAELARDAERGPVLRDAVGRDPRTRGHVVASPVLVQLGTAESLSGPVAGESLRITVHDGGVQLDGAVDPTDPMALDRIGEQLATLAGAGHAAPSTRVRELPIVGPAEAAVLDAMNDTALDHDRRATLDAQFGAGVERHPEAPALSVGASTMTYGELGAAVDAMAARFADLGIGRGDRVGIAVPRSQDMVVGVLATLARGAAYVPLDPTYPADRIGFMVDDAGISLLLASGPTARQLARPDLTVLDPLDVPQSGSAPLPQEHDETDLAYVIYTSGSTGTPKGVMLEHRHVVNFFAAMDEVIEHDPPGVWLAVTSLSFDISVLELMWTLTRGFHVVLKSDSGVATVARPVDAAPARPVTFSLFYFAAGGDAASDGYRLLLESAKFADRNGFEAVWTPERHFHAFGASYPNPSVTGAALAAVTSNVGIRAGSVVLPLHSPIRVAEEWAVVDNLSQGRVAISFAAGWQPDDFVLNPGAFATAKQDLPGNIETVQRLWRGETVTLPGHDGRPVDVRTLPRPVQAELPVWLTSAGSPATFERAGTLGANVLTHLLGQSIEQLGANVERYRAAWREAGHEGEGRVTLMMHTFLDRDADVAREVAREPMKGYLGTAVGLLRDVASAFPTFAGRGAGTDDLFKSLTADELDQLLEVAATRYLGTSGLFGTPADAAAIVEAVSAVGVDEVACLVDFGVATDQVLGSLDLLHETKSLVDARRVAPHAADEVAMPAAEVGGPADDSVAALVDHHAVTHLQCTPSLAAMLVADPADRAALGKIGHLMLGGEALPTALAAEIRRIVPGRFTNMYGPTETTIWSLTHEVDDIPTAPVPIGVPIGNTTVFVLDPGGVRLPAGVFGELHIGGESVARGYHERPELTAERFVVRPGVGRTYATGDVVRVNPAGHVEFAGRSDNQVKIRGHRIELGEIEAVLDHHPDVVQSVVVARTDKGEPRLIAFVIVHDGSVVTSDALRKHVASALPEAMVPSAVVTLDAFPLTPNGKIDRKALPTDVGITGELFHIAVAPPADDVERLVAEIWSAELERPVGRDDNFFDIGGHSLLAVKVFRRLTDATQATLALTDVFRFPTVRTFAKHLGSLQAGTAGSDATAAVPSGADRGSMRRRAMTRRGSGS